MVGNPPRKMPSCVLILNPSGGGLQSEAVVARKSKTPISKPVVFFIDLSPY
jgi:hypothetical protein